MKIYLDACCLSRLTDDQTQVRIYEEATAVEHILGEVRLGKLELIASEALDEEVRRNPSKERRMEAEILLSLAVGKIPVDESIALRAKTLVGLGYGVFEALHLASAESADVDTLSTTDDRLLKQARRNLGRPRIRVRNPVSWFKEKAL